MYNLQARFAPSLGKLLPAAPQPWTAVPGSQPWGKHIGTKQPQPSCSLRARPGSAQTENKVLLASRMPSAALASQTSKS